MIKDLISYLQGKKILILGLGKEGKSTYKLIRKYLKDQKIYISDKNKENLKELEDKNVVSIFGDKYLESLEDYDIIIKSPGISLKEIDTSKFIHKIKSQLELLLEYFDNFTIGITGTKGKSTTSSLIYKILKEQNKRVLLLGNIGMPIFDYIETIKEDTILVLEMSSHQLEYTNLSPNVAVFLNIYEEHLDYYKSIEKYIDAKCNICRYQKKTDYFIYNMDNEILSNKIKSIRDINSNIYKVSIKENEASNIYLKEDNVYFNSEVIYNKNEERNLKGQYNLSNIMFALAVSKILKLDINKAKESIRNFKTLAHRLEFVGKYDGVLYYDNCIGTVPMATIEAINALEKVDTLIIGGMDRGIDYKEFIEYLNSSNIRNIVCMPKTGHNIAKSLQKEKVHIVETLEDAVKIAKEVTKKDSICLLSPAAASYGYFKNFEEKGDLYKELVRNSM